jgi:hypothetical protein
MIRALNVDLDEGAGQFFFFPRRGRLARAEPDDHVLPPRRLARVKRDVLDDPVALIENAEDPDPLRHRCHAALPGSGRGGLVGGDLGIVLLRAAAAAGQREANQNRSDQPHRGYSGTHGW